MRHFLFLCFIATTACTQLPDFGTDADVADTAYPSFLAPEELRVETTAAPPPALPLGRLEQLKARAAVLRGPILSAADKSRVRNGISR